MRTSRLCFIAWTLLAFVGSPRTNAVPDRPDPGRGDNTPNAGDVTTNGIGMKLVYIPSGTFQMGSPAGELEREPYGMGTEKQHNVGITRGFHMGKYEVTQEEYQAVMGENPSKFKGAKLPVDQVSWHDAKAFCKKLSAKEGKTYRLPSEAEWEYACRAGSKTPFHCGETISTEKGNYNGDFVYGNGQKGVFRKTTTMVGSFAANAWGLHDMHGNVSEWCEDHYDAKYYDNSPKNNPLNETAGTARVIRGSSWLHYPKNARSACRNANTPDLRYHDVGFRVALSAP